ncbi:M-phase inducer phosphatase-like [Limulus polyphemus]|uniref:protein-tyrosine-phosphatase n=1 Tax=Limulus polyphemus TaxID=6850 RepID=A0ABM1TPK8_LIMPO|nr:M-phase inducer phosphatase-like [Limulus polyphemus]
MSAWKEEQRRQIAGDYKSSFNINDNETTPKCLIRSTLDVYKSGDKQYLNTQGCFSSKCKIYCLCRDSQVSSFMLLNSSVKDLLVTLHNCRGNYLASFGDNSTGILSSDDQQADNHYIYSPSSSKMSYSTRHELSSSNSSTLTSRFNDSEPYSEALSVSPPLCRLLKDVRIDSPEQQRALRRNKSLPNHLEFVNKENIPNIFEGDNTENTSSQDGGLPNFLEKRLNSDSLSSGFDEFNQDTDQSIIRVSSSNMLCPPNFSTFEEKHCYNGLYDVFDSTENGAKNIYTKPGIVQEFFSNIKKPSKKNCRHIIVFHCEFSSERGPALYKFLREMDRQANKECYPQLYHPEMYILNGGYKAFYEKHWEFCEPQQYKPMKHKDHKHDLCHFRAKSKSLNEDSKTKVSVPSSLIF